jgi:hypothetical protein
MEINPSLEEKKDEIVDSVRVTVGEDGVPFVYAMPHPLLADEIPDKRNWSAVLRPKKETAEKVKALFAEIISKITETPDEFWEATREGGEKYEELTKKEEKGKLLRYLFSDWVNNLLGEVAEKNPFDSESNDYVSGLYAVNGMPTFLKMWAQGIQDLKAPELNNFVGVDSFLNAHDVWGHVGTGRGFDRHGEWTNMLAMFSLMDRWADENNVSEEDLIIAKASWFQALEYSRISGEFTPDREEVKSRDKWWIYSHAISIAPTYATTEQLKQLLELIDDGNTHDTGKSMGFASASSSQKAEIAKNDIVRQTMIRNNSTGFASKAESWRTNTHGVESKINAPESDVFTADESGRTIQVFVPEGVEVVNPRTKEKMILDSLEASREFVAYGGNLSEVPDAHVVDAILKNTEDVPGERATGWRFSKPDGRFEWLGGGGGATGIMRLRDKKTNAIFGIKFEASFMRPDGGDPYAAWTQPYPIADRDLADAPEGIVNEVVAQAILTALGFEPGATRIARRSPLGAGKKNGGAVMIIDFAHNRYGNIRDKEDYAPMKVRRESAIRTLLLDAILSNTDRNKNNFLTSIQSDGTRVIIPIDHGQTMRGRVNRFDLKGAMSSQLQNDDVEYEKILGDMTRAELIAMIPGILADYRGDIEQKKADITKAMNEAIEKLASVHQDGDWVDLDMIKDMAGDYEEKLKNVFSRLDEVAAMSDEDFLELFKYLRYGYK